MEALIAKLSAQMLQFLALSALITTNPLTGFFSALFGAWLATWGRRRWRQEPGMVWRGAMRAGAMLLAVTPAVVLALAIVGPGYVLTMPGMPRTPFYSPLVGLVAWAVGAGAGALLGRRRAPLPGETIDPAIEARRRRLGRLALWLTLAAVPLTGILPGLALPALAAAVVVMIIRAGLRPLSTERTDSRSVLGLLPTGEDQDPARDLEADPRRAGMYLGRDAAGQAVRIPYATWRQTHVQIVGTTGAGKGVAASVLLAQSLRAGEAVVVIDPKDDEWAPSVLAASAASAGVPFALVDLRVRGQQLDLLAGADARDVAELVEAAFSLAPRGEAADHYRRADRRAARRLAEACDPAGGLAGMYGLALGELRKVTRDAEGLLADLEELVESVPAVAGRGGIDLRNVIANGGCVYVIGGTAAALRAAQRALLIRTIQIASRRDRMAGELRPVRIFADEFRYCLSRPALDALALARDKGVGLILAHQSLADLRDTPADLRPDMVAGAITENCALKVVYRVHDADTADWLARLSGTVLAQDESEGPSGRSVRLVDRATVDENMLLRLPARVAVLYRGGEIPQPVCISPIRAEKRRIVPAVVASTPATSEAGEARAVTTVEGLFDV